MPITRSLASQIVFAAVGDPHATETSVLGELYPAEPARSLFRQRVAAEAVKYGVTVDVSRLPITAETTLSAYIDITGDTGKQPPP